MLSGLEEDKTSIKTISFSDEATFYLHGTINSHHGRDNRHEITGHERDSPRVNTWCSGMKHIIGLLILEESTVADETFLVRMEDITLRRDPPRTLSQL
jgi:hypothetical protein